MRLKSLLPVLILGGVLAAIIVTARFTQDWLHEREQRAATPSPPAAVPPRKEAPPPDPNSVADPAEETERLAQAYPDMVVMPRGLRYKVLREGSGRQPVTDSRIVAHYRGRLLDGTVFDTSYARGQPIRFRLNRGEVILGWDLILQDMRKGEQRLVVVPYKLAYGEAGKPPTIPPRAPLVFEIELVDFN